MNENEIWQHRVLSSASTLGTTNCALAYVDTGRGDDLRCQTLAVPQVVNPGAVEPRNLLPSFLYLPGDERATGGQLETSLGRRSRLLRRRVCPQFRFAGADPAGLFRQVVALPSGRRSQGADFALESARHDPAHLAAGSDSALSQASWRRRGTTPSPKTSPTIGSNSKRSS